jgi:hypothetical protein
MMSVVRMRPCVICVNPWGTACCSVSVICWKRLCGHGLSGNHASGRRGVNAMRRLSLHARREDVQAVAGNVHARKQFGTIGNDEQAAILTVARTIFSERRTTSLVRTIAAPIYEEARKVPGRLSQPLGTGVFPFRWFNGHSSEFEAHRCVWGCHRELRSDRDVLNPFSRKAERSRLRHREVAGGDSRVCADQ